MTFTLEWSFYATFKRLTLIIAKTVRDGEKVSIEVRQEVSFRMAEIYLTSGDLYRSKVKVRPWIF